MERTQKSNPPQMKLPTQEAYQLFHEGTLALADVEANGFRVDIDYVKKTRAELKNRVSTMEGELREHDVYRLWRKEFGPNAGLSKRKQLGKLLFGKLGFTAVSFTDKPDPKTGKPNPAVDEATFESLALLTDKEDETVKFLRKYVRTEKLKKADDFLNGIESNSVLCGKFHTLHPTYGLNIAQSYRSQSEDPNAQNWPLRDPEQGKLVRSSFIPRPNHHILEIDFSGNEIKSAACYHKDPKFIDDVLHGDMHRDTAAELFLCKKEEVNKEARQTAKNKFVFAEFFGDWYMSCAQLLWEDIARYNLKVGDVPMKKHLAKKGINELGDLDPNSKPTQGTFTYLVKSVEDSFWNKRYKVYTQWKNDWWDLYVRRGWLQMYTGFVVQGPYNRKQVINYPIQGTAFHWLLWCVIKINKWLRKNKMRTMIIGQIHDSIIFDAHKDELDAVREYAIKVMTVLLPKHWHHITIPMAVEAECSPLEASWHEKKKVA
jgi:DNA polymerase-1